MKIGIMQPYFLPYIGYFQLIKSVDTYVIYDDVNFIKGGWINRNRILLNGGEFMINVPMQGASAFKKINEINLGKITPKLFSTIEQAYRKAPYFKEVLPVIIDILNFETANLSTFISNSIVLIAQYLDIKTEIILSSEISKDIALKSQNKVIEICEILGATEYHNAIGGKELYGKSQFAKKNIELKFLKTNPIVYNQFNNDFIPWLSILDVMMFNPVAEINNMLNSYELV